MGDSDAEELSVGVPSPVIGSTRRHQQRGASPHHLLMIDDDSGSATYRFLGVGAGRRSQHPSGDSTSSAGGGGNDNSSTTTTSTSQQSQQRHPTCALCKNHQTVSVLKGHKRYCPWRQCLCELCYSTNKKRKINAEQVAQRRAQAQDEELRRKGALLPDTVPSASEHPPAAVVVVPPVTMDKNKNKEPVISHKEGRMQLPSATSSSSAAAAAALVSAGPVVFGQQLSLGSILMSQNVSLLRDSVCCDSRLDYDILKWIFKIVHSVRFEVDKVVEQLDLIQKDIQFKIHPTTPVFGPPPPAPAPPPPPPPQQQQQPPPPPPLGSPKSSSASSSLPPHYPQFQPQPPHQFRPTVINGPAYAAAAAAAASLVHPTPYYPANWNNFFKSIKIWFVFFVFVFLPLLLICIARLITWLEWVAQPHCDRNDGGKLFKKCFFFQFL